MPLRLFGRLRGRDLLDRLHRRIVLPRKDGVLPESASLQVRLLGRRRLSELDHLLRVGSVLQHRVFRHERVLRHDALLREPILLRDLYGPWRGPRHGLLQELLRLHDDWMLELCQGAPHGRPDQRAFS